ARSAWGGGPVKSSASAPHAGAARTANAPTIRPSCFAKVLIRLLADSADLGTLDPHTSHQAPLVEDERVDVTLERRACERSSDALVHHDDARTDADFPAVTVVEILDRGVRHQEERVAEPLHAGLQAVRSRDGAVKPDRTAILAEHALAILSAYNEAR